MAQFNQNIPEGWEARFDPRVNKHYFLNHQTKETTWEDPRISSANQGGLVMNSNPVQKGTPPSTTENADIKSSGSSMEDQLHQKLPEGWEARFDQRVNKYYFLNHQTKETTWEAPGQTSTNQGGLVINSNPVQQENPPHTSDNLTPSIIARDSKQADITSSGSSMGLNAGQQSMSSNGLTYPVTAELQVTGNNSSNHLLIGQSTGIQNYNDQGQSTVQRDAKIFFQKSKEIQLKSSATLQKGKTTLPVSKGSAHSSKSFTDNHDDNKEMKVQLGLEFPGLSQKEIDSALVSTSYNLNHTIMLLNIINKKLKKPIVPKNISVELPEISGNNYDILEATSSNSIKSLNVKNNISSKNSNLSLKVKKVTQNSADSKYRENKENMNSVNTALIKDEYDLATSNSKITQIFEIPVPIPSTSSHSGRIYGNTFSEKNLPKVTVSPHSIIPSSATSTKDSTIYTKEPSLSDQSQSIYNSSVSTTIFQDTSIKPNEGYFQQSKEYISPTSRYQSVKSAHVFQSSAKGYIKTLQNGHNKDLLLTHCNVNEKDNLLDNFDKLLKRYSKPNLSKGADKNLQKGPKSFTLGHDHILCKGPIRLQKK